MTQPMSEHDPRATERHRLGGYVEFRPPPALERYVDALWTHTAEAGAHPPSVTAHRVVPDPCVSLAFTCRREDDGRVDAPLLLLIGPVRVPRFFPIEVGREMSAVRLHAEWAQPLFGIDPREHPTAVTDLTEVCPRLADPLLYRMTATRSAAEARALLGEAVRDALARHREPGGLHPLACVAAHALRGSRGRLRVEPLARELGVSPRHLRRAMQAPLGLSPKALASVLRFQSALLAADRTARPSWSALAVRFGYYDQAHLIGEFQALCGLTPQILHRERRAESVSSNTA
jgi:AraC-like DNA-binding protein